MDANRGYIILSSN